MIGRLERLGPLKDLLNVPYLPVTPLFPWLGPLGIIPLPTKWRIRFGPPVRFWENRRIPRHPQAQTIRVLAERTRRRVQAMVHDLLAERDSVF